MELRFTLSSISKSALGERFDRLSLSERKKAVEGLFEVLDAIHFLEPAGKGHGAVKVDGDAYEDDWRKQIIFNHGDPDSWKEAAENFPTIKDVGFLRQVNRKLINRTRDLPNLRKVVHGDFTYGNLFVHENQISAVIDWALSVYGDPLYDVARLHFWNSEDEINYFFEYQKRHPNIEGYKDRIDAYMIDIALSSIYHHAKRGDIKPYQYIVSLLREKLS